MDGWVDLNSRLHQGFYFIILVKRPPPLYFKLMRYKNTPTCNGGTSCRLWPSRVVLILKFSVFNRARVLYTCSSSRAAFRQWCLIYSWNTSDASILSFPSSALNYVIRCFHPNIVIFHSCYWWIWRVIAGNWTMKPRITFKLSKELISI